MLNILIPMAGKGQRFADAGYTELKPFIRINGEPMIYWVILNIVGHLAPEDYKLIIVIDPDIEDRYAKELADLKDKYRIEFVSTNGQKQHGQAWSCRLAERLVDTNDPLLIINCDQIVRDFNSDWLRPWLQFAEGADGSVALLWSNHPKWSYAKIANGQIVETAEKQVISEHATVGAYYFAKGHDFVQYSDQMIKDQETVNGEYYVAPVYNRMIQQGAIIKPYWTNDVWGIGTPVDLAKYAKKFGLTVQKGTS